MAEIVNLRRARKAKARSEAEAKASQNRISFGRTKAEREQTQAEKTLQSARLDGHHRDVAPSDKDEA